MDAADRGGGERTFRATFTGEGADKLRDSVREKLKEYMGEYTDDTLVEYVVVLLRNGRRKDEAMKELNVFLGDDCVPFVSWLWDHLSSNLHLYVQSSESFLDEAAKTKPISSGQSGRLNVQLGHVNDHINSGPEYDSVRPTNASRNRHNREWKGLMQQETEPSSLRSTVGEEFHSEEENHWKPNFVKQSYSPRFQDHRKRSREEKSLPKKGEATSRPIMVAPSRLLQFAVRDAVKTVQKTNLRMEPVLKRLRSIVSTSTTDYSLPEEQPRVRPIARASGGLLTALKAAAQSAEDASKMECSGNVFDRLGHRMDIAETVNQTSDFKEPVLERETEDVYEIPGSMRRYQNDEYVGDLTDDVTMVDPDTEMSSDSASDNDGYNSINFARYQGLDVSQSASSANKDKGSPVVQYSAAQHANGARKISLMDQDPLATSSASASHKIVNISVNVNTWKPPRYENSNIATDVRKQLAGEKSNAGTGKPNVQLPMENNTANSKKENDVDQTDAGKAQNIVTSIGGAYTTGRPSVDVDSRIVFVSNVHFAATKDNLSRHFNKFGEVLKVIIVTDAATGQPRGSAYVEFLRKESAELALSLNGTSFMSRILKVVRRSAAHHESGPTIRRAHIARRAAVPYPRGGGAPASAFRSRGVVKPGARSLQWKRGAPAAVDGGRILPSSVLTSGRKNLTYVRKETKAAPTLLA